MSYLSTEISDFSTVDTRNPSNGRSDVVIIKDLQSAANCVVAPSVEGSVPIANTLALVNGFNAAAGGGLIRPAVQVPGTNSYGAFSLCGALGSFLRANTPAGTYLFDAGAGGEGEIERAVFAFACACFIGVAPVIIRPVPIRTARQAQSA